jgi:hypothetical protein
MALRAEFSLINSELNGFLFAPIGEEENGTQLTVLSALSRLALDPWGEAARLSDLPKEMAVTALAATITRLPTGRWEPSDIRVIAARLVQLLPDRAPALPPTRSGSGERKHVPAAFWLAVLLVCTVFLGVWSVRTAPTPHGVPAPSQHEQLRDR